MLLARIEHLLFGGRVVYGRWWGSIPEFEVGIHGFVGVLAAAIKFIYGALALTRFP